MARWLFGFAMLALAGCEGAVAAVDGGAEGGVPPADATVDAAPDAAPADGGTEAGPLDGSAVDAGDAGSAPDASCGPCTPSGECVTSSCVGGSCVEEPVEDGTGCGEMGASVCVAGACVMRGCGDGYREPGSSSMREGCDDGNTEDGDSCSSTCEPTPFLVHADEMEDWDVFPTAAGPALGIDGSGRLLFAWSEDGGDAGRVRAKLYDRYAVPVGAGEPIDVDDVGAPPTADPVVVGLSGGGWVIAWAAERMLTEDVVFRIVQPDGTLGPEVVANVDRSGDQDQVRAASLGDGFVLVWTDHVGRTDDPQTGVRARRFDAAGAALGGELLVATDRSDRQDEPMVASDGGDWLVVWRQSTLTAGAPRTTWGRRFRAGTALDSAQFSVTVDDPSTDTVFEGGEGASIAPRGMGEWVAVWEQGGDLYGRVIASSDPSGSWADVDDITTASALEWAPSVGPLAGGDYLVAWLEGTPQQAGFGASPAAMLVPEAAILDAWLPMGAEGHVSVTPSPDGVWVLWSGVDFATGTTGFGAFHMPRD